MKSITIPALVLSIMSTLWTPLAVADPGNSCHFHGKKPAAEATVSACAMQRKDALVKSKKLDASWSAIKPASIEAVDGKKGKEWKVIFSNPASTDKSKTNLYLFFSESGNFIAANHSGK